MSRYEEVPPDEMLATVDRLTSALIDGTGTVAEQAALESLLRSSAEARNRFRTILHAESILAWKFAAPGRQLSDTVAQVGGHAPKPAARPRPGPRHWWSVPGGGQIAIAAAAISAAFALLHMRPVPTVQPESAGPPIVARLVDATDARWADGRAMVMGAAVPQGPLRLLSGAAQIAFESGALVTLNGPAEIEVLGASRLFLRSGRIVPFVPPAATGFTVVSPTGEVIDLGTEFSVSVDASGRTDVYVLDGQVDVAQGHADRSAPVRMSQGFGSRLAAAAHVEVTDMPLIIDHFEDASGPLRWRDVDPTKPTAVMEGGLHMPIMFQDDQTGDHRGNARLVVDHDFARLRARRSTISYKVVLPNEGLTNEHRWVACVVDQGEGPPPMAYETTAAIGVLISPEWQAGVRIAGEAVHQSRVFTRSDEAVGPYQVLMEIDDTAAAHKQHGVAVLSVTVNGRELLRNQPVSFGDQPRIGFQTFCSNTNPGRGVAVIDDFSVSISAD